MGIKTVLWLSCAPHRPGDGSLTNATVVIIFFNRPRELKRVWDAVSKVKPAKLVAISDGPRRVEERVLVDACRSIIMPDWNCDLVRLYRESNLGCRNNIVDGLTEVFRTEEKPLPSSFWKSTSPMNAFSR